MSKYRNCRALRNRLHIRASSTGTAGIVKQDEFDRVAINAAVPVDFINIELDRLKAFHPGRLGSTSDGVREGDPDRRLASGRQSRVSECDEQRRGERREYNPCS